MEEFAGRPTVYGDSAYGSGEFQGCFSRAASTRGAAPSLRPRRGAASPRTARRSAAPSPWDDRRHQSPRRGSGTAAFGAACHGCALRGDCTDAAGGRTVRISANEAVLAASRARQQDPAWRNDYRAVRPKVERKLAHLVRRKHGGRHARVRGRAKVDADFNLLAAAANIARLGVRTVSTPQRWPSAEPLRPDPRPTPTRQAPAHPSTPQHPTRHRTSTAATDTDTSTAARHQHTKHPFGTSHLDRQVHTGASPPSPMTCRPRLMSEPADARGRTPLSPPADDSSSLAMARRTGVEGFVAARGRVCLPRTGLPSRRWCRRWRWRVCIPPAARAL